MQTRHRIPTIFNLYMVDVLCCTLGCVILLWLLNLREVKVRMVALEKTTHELEEKTRETAEVRESLRKKVEEATATASLLEAARSEGSRLSRRAEGAEQQRDKLRLDLDTVNARLAELEKTLTALESQKAQTEKRLTEKTKAESQLSKDLSVARQFSDTLQTQLKDKEALAQKTKSNLDDLADRLRGAEARLKLLQIQADLVPGLRDEARAVRDKLSSTEAKALALEKDIGTRQRDLASASKTLQGLESAYAKLLKEIDARTKDLSDADRRILALESDKRSLADLANRVRAAAENRFAGVTLTGRRVVFLVDMSGSMQLLDERTPASDKWTAVYSTLAKIMRSIPNLEKFQVVLFSDKVFYPLGNEERWIDYEPQMSADRVTRALAAVKPKGGTNLHAAFESAFRLRAQGMDTIYLLSDGLPNMGPGLSAEDSTRFKEIERGDLLGKYLRKLIASDWNREIPGQPRVRINAVGFFYESPDVGAFLWALAREHDGSFVGMSKP